MSFKETGGVTLGRRSGFLKMANLVTVPNTWDQIEAGSKFDTDSQANPGLDIARGFANGRKLRRVAPAFQFARCARG